MQRSCRVWAIVGLFLISFTSARAARADAPPVTIAQDAGSFTLDNGIVIARVDKHSGNLLSLRYGPIETLDHGRSPAYWSHTPARATAVIATVTVDPGANGGACGEVSVKGSAGGKPLGNGPGGSVIADIEVRFALVRGVSGVYTYSILHHPADYPATSIGEARFAAKLNDSVFDWMTVDANRNREMITAYDWDHGTRLNMKEARRMTTGVEKGQAEHKYDYSAVLFDTPAFGWSSSKQHVGFWFVNPSCEYIGGGATKLELTTHRDATFTDSLTAPAPPVVLNYWRGSHYGGVDCSIAAGEDWTKVVGPFLLYCNAGASPDAMWHDALARAAAESKAWPYPWVGGVDYPHASERGTVTGAIKLVDPGAPNAALVNLRIGLAHPDYVPPGGGRGLENGKVDWQTDGKFYEFWTRSGDGRFTIPNVRPGTYTLHAISDSVLGEFSQANVTVEAGKTVDLGSLTWTPVRYGRQVWEIGVPDRTSGEFLHGDHYFQWGLYNEYPRDFPNDVNFVIGKSDFHRDWNYAQVPRAIEGDTRGNGTSTTWTVTFSLPTAPTGTAILRLSLASTSARSISVAVNDQPAGAVTGLADTAGIRRDADRGYWRERDVRFDAGLLKAGTNTLKLTIPAGNVMSGVEYDYLRLEVAP